METPEPKIPRVEEEVFICKYIYNTERGIHANYNCISTYFEDQ